MEGPLTIGLTIKEDTELRNLIDIVDEERRIVIEGYIFDVDVKELQKRPDLVNI